jgi:hypothetical protein
MKRHRSNQVPTVQSLLTVAIALWLLGCGGPKPAPETKPPASPTVSSTPTTHTTPPSDKPLPEQAVAPAAPSAVAAKSAAAAVQKVLQALESGNLAEAYDFLPPDYQSDVDGLLHEFADRMDPEVWARLIETCRKSLEVLKSRKNEILALDLFRDREESEPYRKHWDSSVQLLGTLLDSDVAELPKLKQITVRSLLSGKASPAPTLQQFDDLGLALGTNLTRQFAGVTVAPVRTAGAEQVVAIRGPRDEQPVEFSYIQHEGRWLPKSLVEHWDDGIKADRAWLEKLPERIKIIKPRLMEALSQTDEILDQLLAADNREQFEQAAGPAILSLATAWPNLQLMARQAVSGNTELPHASISINRELTEAELTRFVAAVLKPLQESGSDYTVLANDGRTVCRVMRISDVVLLQASLATHFKIPAASVQLDRDASRISIDLQ